MELKLLSQPSEDNKTPGVLYVDGVKECMTLEDQVREVKGRPVAEWKVPKETAIPAGKYRVAMTMSARFKRVMIQLLNVPGFEGVRIHSGTDEHDTEGCILVGDTFLDGRLSGGKLRGVLTRLEAKVEAALDAREEVWIEVVRS